MLLCILFVAYAFTISWASLDRPWFNDDLHLIRAFTGQELLSTWHGSWDIDGIESPGFRPLTTLFNHVRYAAFGEDFRLQHLFQVIFYALTLILLSQVFLRLGAPALAVGGAGILDLSAKYTAYHLTWLADGVHVLQGLCFALTMFAFLQYLRAGSHRGNWLGVFVLAAAACLLIRDDSIIIVPLIATLAAATCGQRWLSGLLRQQGVVRTVQAVVAVTILAAAVWWWRASVLPDPGVTLAKSSLLGIARQLGFTILLSGDDGAGGVYRALAVAAAVATAAYPVLLRLRPVGERGGIALWILALAFAGCSFISCMPGAVVSRSNLTYFATYFYCLWLATLAAAFVELLPSGTLSKWVALGFSMVALAALAVPAARSSILTQETMAPSSIVALTVNSLWIFGAQKGATLPVSRRAVEETLLIDRGVNQSVYNAGALSRIYCDALAARSLQHSDDGRVFVPVAPFFGDDGWYEPPACSP